MATQQGIQTHDRLLNTLADDFERGLQPVMNDVFSELANIGLTRDRLAIQRAFQPVQAYLIAQVQNLDGVVQSIVDVNSDVIAQPIDAQTLEAVEVVKTQTREEVAQVIEAETNNIINIVVLAAIAGAVATDLIRQTQRELVKSRRRISTAFANRVYQFDTTITRLRARLAGVEYFRYVGGTIATSRDFCRRHDGRVYSEQEIRSIWRSTWGGKAPGDPFVVRGGYNCRHWWVPVTAEEAND